METRNELTSSAAGFPAKTSPSLVSALASQVLEAVSGSSTCDSFASFDRASSSWRTSQLSLLEDWTSSSVDLPKRGMMRSGSLYELPTLAPRTFESGSSSWPTATATDAKSSARVNPATGETCGTKMARVGLDGAGTLLDSIRLWATPTARDWKDGACAEADVPTNGLLGRQAPRWCTPTVEDAGRAGDSEMAAKWARGETIATCHQRLRTQVLWPTSSRPDQATTTDGEAT